MKTLMDLLFFIGIWFIGMVNRTLMAEIMEKTGRNIKEMERYK